MSALMKQYGRTVFCCIAAALVFGILFHIREGEETGFIRVIYKKAMAEEIGADRTDDTDAAAAMKAAAREKPVIEFTCKKIRPQEAVNLRSMFAVKDADQMEAAFEITDVLDAAGNSIMYRTTEDRENKIVSYAADSFIFPSAGIYTVKIKAVDAEQKMTSAQYRIPVTGN